MVVVLADVGLHFLHPKKQMLTDSLVRYIEGKIYFKELYSPSYGFNVNETDLCSKINMK